MPINWCDICGCIPPNIEPKQFYQAALNLLCDIAANTGGGGSTVNLSESIRVSNAAVEGLGVLPVGIQLVALDVIEAGSTATVLNLTAHLALPGDVVRFPAVAQAGTTSRQWSVVESVTANTVTLSNALSFTPVALQDVSISRDVPIGAYGSSSSGLTSMNVGIDSDAQRSQATGILKLEDSATASGDAGVAILLKRLDVAAAQTTTDGDYTLPVATQYGAALVSIERGFQGNQSNGLLHAEDDAVGGGDAGVGVLMKVLAAPVSQAGDGDYGLPLINDVNAQYTDGVRRGTFTHTQPTIATATSSTLVASNTARRYLVVQNNSAANIMINLNNGTLTGIAPTSTNLGIVLAAGASYETPPNACPTAAVTCFQTSGGNLNTISVIEQS